ncbi:hypothetical protein J3Q64DRAFT_1767175 [Phycomyces blakesleeanus]|uniref:CHCH domain-containing protein n=2 Tax=Phycomyces blakesleeanus TaxID=4837 RepID=A0A162UBU9_PHYB8|nr:hypothetical protein PHYBLDRAFT_181044 [Phycomyces blakesleeanus NRRL 1555(-)]OAD75072.1 hypothetical protein PHYBLDRAFT_181044 [Phycomyces blakesleeanus NRRL 1555(-)]|eukprot:XP_018293112.1 hypothetical protein PHYBLDRAFT_181044 [Phycomyces blakesleeanus NRRL 1555(-)]
MARQRQSRRSPSPAPQRRQAHTAARPPPQQQHQQQPQHSMAPTQQNPPAVQQQQSGRPGLFGQMASTAAGVAVGSTIGHTMAGGISSMFGGDRSEPVDQQGQSAPQDYQQNQSYPQQQNYQASTPGASACETDARQFTKCLEQNNNDVSACQWYLENLKACQQMASNY